ncbi:MAG: MFS transporter [Dehalococcoidia bacterium]|nr:MFS transporter [Dehalococcoidia bacterium]
MTTTKDAGITTPAPTTSSDYYWVTLGTGFVLLFAGMGFARYAYPMLLPNMQNSLGVTYGPMGALGTVNLVGYTAFALGSGILASRFGAKIVATASMVLVGLGMIGLGLVSDYWIDFLLMLLIGMGTAGVFTPLAGLLRAWAPLNRGGFTMGVLSSGSALGIVVATFVIPLILTAQGEGGWRPAWIYLGITTLALATLGGVTLKEKPRSDGSGRGGAPSPLAWGQVFRNRTIAGICLTYFLWGFYQIYATFFITYLRNGLKLPAETVGNIWFYWAVLAFLLMAGWGLLSDRIGRKRTMALCAVPLLASILMPIFLHDVTFLYASAMIYGATYAGPMQIILAAAAESVPLRLAAAALGLVTAAFGLGQAVSPAIGGYLIDLTGSFYPGFILSAVAMALSLVIFVLWPLKKAS